MYNIGNGSWRQGTPFPTPIGNAASVELDGTLLVVGGTVLSTKWTGLGISDKIFKYVPATGTWELLPMRIPCGLNGACLYLPSLQGYSCFTRTLARTCKNFSCNAADCYLVKYWVSLKGSYVVARIFFLLLLNCSAWPCLVCA